MSIECPKACVSDSPLNLEAQALANRKEIGTFSAANSDKTGIFTGIGATPAARTFFPKLLGTLE